MRMSDLPSSVVHRLMDDEDDHPKQSERSRARLAVSQRVIVSPHVERILATIDGARLTAAAIAVATALSVDYVQAALWSLARRGWVRRVDRKGKGVRRRRVIRWERKR